MARVLVAEDDAHVLRLMSMWLSRNEHTVIEATDGLEAKSLLTEQGAECLVTDINMPGLDGVSLVRWLRDEAKMDMPVIMLSARCDQVRIGEELSDYNVSIHPKPFSPSRMIAEIEERLSVGGQATPQRFI